MLRLCMLVHRLVQATLYNFPLTWSNPRLIIPKKCGIYIHMYIHTSTKKYQANIDHFYTFSSPTLKLIKNSTMYAVWCNELQMPVQNRSEFIFRNESAIKNRRSWVRIPPRCKVFLSLYIELLFFNMHS
jgi:hypothetical protein